MFLVSVSSLAWEIISRSLSLGLEVYKTGTRETLLVLSDG